MVVKPSDKDLAPRPSVAHLEDVHPFRTGIDRIFALRQILRKGAIEAMKIGRNRGGNWALPFVVPLGFVSNSGTVRGTRSVSLQTMHPVGEDVAQPEQAMRATRIRPMSTRIEGLHRVS